MAELHEVAEPLLFGTIPPVAIVSASMAVLILIMLWKKVPALITSGLDKQISAIRDQLEEARVLRAEAEKLRADYAARIASAEKDAEAMLDHARHEAEAIVARAAKDTAAVISRREKMASDKIAAVEHAAVDELRQRAVDAAAGAAAQLIAARLGSDADQTLVNGAINGLVNLSVRIVDPIKRGPPPATAGPFFCSEHAVHDQGVDQAEAGVRESGGLAADHGEAQRLPQSDRMGVAGDHEIELHRGKALGAGAGEGVFCHDAAHTATGSVAGNHIAAIGDMGSAAGLIGP